MRKKPEDIGKWDAWLLKPYEATIELLVKKGADKNVLRPEDSAVLESVLSGRLRRKSFNVNECWLAGYM